MTTKDASGAEWSDHDHNRQRGESVTPDPSSDESLFAKVGELCETATRLTGVDGATVASLMTSRSRELICATDAVAERIDELQFTVGEGPCLDAYIAQWPELCPDIGAAGPRHRWFAFSAGVQDLGVHAVFAFPVPGPQHPLGVLELYRRTRGPLGDDQLNYAALCADTIGHVIMAAVSPTLSPAEATLRAEAVLQRPSNPFARSEMQVAAEMVALQLNVSADEALIRIRAHAYARDESVTEASTDIMAGRLTLPA
jgi:GAF domain-containing protein